MTGMLIAYDVDGNVLHTRDYQVIYDPDTLEPLGLADYAAHEDAGGTNDAWWWHETWKLDKNGKQVPVDPQPVKGSKVWPEWIGGAAHFFKVRLDGPPGQKYIGALIHKESGYVRERADIEAAIAERINDKKAEAKKRGDEMRKLAKAKKLPQSYVDAIADPEPEPVEISDIVGHPDRPLQLDENGRTKPKVKPTRPSLPVVGMEKSAKA